MLRVKQLMSHGRFLHALDADGQVWMLDETWKKVEMTTEHEACPSCKGSRSSPRECEKDAAGPSRYCGDEFHSK